MNYPKYLTIILVLTVGIAFAEPPDKGVIVKNTLVNPVPTEITNHLGPKRPSDLVTLISVDDDCTGVGLKRVFPDATVVEGWRVPAGSVLVGTGFDWRGRNGTPGEIVEILLFIFEPTDFRAEAPFRDYAQVGDDGEVGQSVSVQNAVWGPGTIVCVNMRGADFQDAALRGYLVPNE